MARLVASPPPVSMATGRRRRNFVNPCVKYTLFLFNFAFWLAGCCMMLVGGAAVLMKKDAFASVTSAFTLLLDLTLLFIVLGVCVFLLAFAGCLGSLRDNVRLLKLYSASLLCIFFVEFSAAVAVLVLKERAVNYVESVLKDNVIGMYREERFADTQSFIDWYQRRLRCCGVGGFADWSRNKYFACTPNNTMPQRCSVPYSCCKTVNNVNGGWINTRCGFGVLSPRYRRRPGSVVWTVGCLPATHSYVRTNVVPLAAGLLAVSFVQLTACWLARTLAAQIEDQVLLLTVTGQLPP